MTDAASPQTPAATPAVFHLGLHKTGTTWLQQNIFQTNRGRTIRYVDDRRLIRGPFVVDRYGAFSAEAARAALEAASGAETHGALPLVVSDEALTGFPFQMDLPRQVTFERIRAAYPEAGIIVTIREQVSLIRSYYGHYIRWGGTARLENFLAQPEGDDAKLYRPVLDLDFFDYDALHRDLSGIFGAEKVLFLPLEVMIRDTDTVLARMRQSFGLDLSKPDRPIAERVNPAWSGAAFGAARRLNHLIAGQPKWHRSRRRLNPNYIASLVDRVTPDSARKRATAQQTAVIRRSIGTRYAPSNAAFAARSGWDLAALGYTTA